MNYFEFYQAYVKENLTNIKACLIKSVKEGEKVVTIFSTLCLVKDNFDSIKEELKEKLSGLCRVKSSHPKVFCDFRTYGLEVHILSDDKDILISRILGLFEGLSIPAEDNHVELNKGKQC